MDSCVVLLQQNTFIIPKLEALQYHGISTLETGEISPNAPEKMFTKKSVESIFSSKII